MSESAMSDSTMSEAHPWRPTRRGLRDGVLAGLAPVAACALALGGLTAWTGSGAAGSPARVTVARGSVFVPVGATEETVAFFPIANSGGSDDRLTSVDSPVFDDVMLSRTVPTGRGAATMRGVRSAAVPAGEGLIMSPRGLDIMVRTRGPLKVGETVPFVLTFRHGGRIEAEALVVGPGG
ncbi:copper chaperone PCu(A)C [Streptomyces sp. NPDC005865]|uniref:copper chaperone PCu(A)C n=1 Tax=Streptomyces sp. NPDC005865 TaxID=3155453 RepID=UPI0033F2DF69